MILEGVALARNPMNGFWTANDCFVFQSTWIYEPDAVSLDLFTVVEEKKTWRIYNWMQHFSPESIKAELQAHGFELDHLGSAFGKNDEAAGTLKVVARPS